MSKQIIVIGGGPAGVEAALTAARAGAGVTLVSETPIGGRAGWASLVPSKVWLHAADTFGIIQAAGIVGIALDGAAKPDAQAVVARIRQVAKGWNGQLAEQLKQAGVTVLTGVAALASPTSVSIEANGETTELTADAIIVAAGSVPVFPPAMRPDGKRVLAPRFASKLDTLPASVVVVGAGATGVEFAYLFNRLGVRVTWIVSEKGVLPMFAEGAGDFVAQVLAKRGINVVGGQRATAVDADDDGVTVTLVDGTTHRADMAFLAVGRTADVSRLNVEAAGLAPGTKGELAIDEYGRSAVPTIYAAGDVTGLPMLANQATAQARVAASHAAGASTAHAYRPETVIHAVFSEPQVAQVGRFDEESGSAKLAYDAGLKAHLLADAEGYIELHYDQTSRLIQGGVAVGPHAVDAVAPIAMAIRMGASVEDLAGPSGGYPSVSELAFAVAQQI